jgi:hypothetical protein
MRIAILGRRPVWRADRRLEPWQLRTAEPAAVDVDVAELGAAVQLREDLAGIEDLGGVEGALHALLLVQVDLIEHPGIASALTVRGTVLGCTRRNTDA